MNRDRINKALAFYANRYARSGFDMDYLEGLSDENAALMLSFAENYYGGKREGQNEEHRREANRRRNAANRSDIQTNYCDDLGEEHAAEGIDYLDPETLLLLKEELELNPPPEPVEKICSKCHESRELMDFYSDPRAKDGMRSSCKYCR